MSLFGAIKTGFGFAIGIVVVVIILGVIIAAGQDQSQKEAQEREAFIQRCYPNGRSDEDKTGCTKEEEEKATRYWNENTAEMLKNPAQTPPAHYQKMNFD